MIRTIWLTIACLAVLGAATVGKALKTPAAETPVGQSTVGTGLAKQPLTKADRLEIAYVRQETPVQSALQPTDPFIPSAPTIAPPTETKIISRHRHAPDATNSSAGKSKKPPKMVNKKKGNPAVPKPVQLR